MRIVQSTKQPCEQSVMVENGLWCVVDDSEIVSGDVLGGDDLRVLVGERFDLPATHPLHGKRALRNVPAGFGDIVIDDDGSIDIKPCEFDTVVVERVVRDG